MVSSYHKLEKEDVMAWRETTKMEQKIEFINEWRSGAYKISELCRAFGISRPTAYKYIKRFQEEGVVGLEEKKAEPTHSTLLKHLQRSKRP